MKTIITICHIFIFWLVLLISSAQSQIPSQMQFQGILTTTAGVAVPDGSYSMTFRLYTSATATNPIWQETQTVAVSSGIFSVQLGKVVPLNLPFDQGYFLGIQVGSDPELPRLALLSSPYSFRAKSAEIGGDLSGTSSTAATVTGLQGYPIAPVAPSTGQVLMWNGIMWTPTSASGSSGDSAWALTGNAGTDPAINFLGTTDNQPLVIRTNNVERMRIATTGNVGIGTTSPSARLHIGGDGMVIAEGTYATGQVLPISGARTAMIWYPRKAAFRAGSVTGTQWDDGNIGDYSAVSGGRNNTASGWYSSIGGGQYNTASGDWSSIGGGAYNTASGNYSSIGGGQYNTASGYMSTVTGGNKNTAAGAYSWAGGGRMYLAASADRTFVWGYATSTSAITTANAFLIGPYGYYYKVGINTANPSYALTLPNNTSQTVGKAIANAWVTYSDARIKSEIQPVQDGLHIIQRLRPLHYFQHNTSRDGKRIESTGAYRYGFVAQELAKVLPEAVVPPADSSDLWGIDYMQLIPILTAALQEQQQMIEYLKAENQRQARQIQELQAMVRTQSQFQRTVEHQQQSETHGEIVQLVRHLQQQLREQQALIEQLQRKVHATSAVQQMGTQE